MHCEFICESRSWCLPCPPLYLVSFQGSWCAPPRPRRRRPLCPSADPRRGLGAGARESREGGSPAAVPGWVNPGRNLLGGRVSLTSLLGPGGSPSLCPGLLCIRKAFGSPAGVCFCSAGNSPESGEKLGWAVAPGGGHGGSSRCGSKAKIGGGGRFPPLGGEWVPIAGQCRRAGSGSAARQRAWCPPRPRTVTRLPSTLESAGYLGTCISIQGSLPGI